MAGNKAPTRIAVTGDLHYDPSGQLTPPRMIRALVEEIRAEKPDAVIMAGDLAHGLVQLGPAITAPRPEDVAGQTFAVHAHEHVRVRPDVAHDQGEVMLAVELGTIKVEVKLAVVGRHLHHLDLLNELLARPPEMDERFDRAKLELMPAGELPQLGQPGH